MSRKASRADIKFKGSRGLRLVPGLANDLGESGNPWADSSTWDMLSDSSEKWGDRPAVIDADRRLTYSELKDAVSAAAGGLGRIGVGPGTRVGIVVGTSWLSVVSIYAALRCGATLISLNPRWDSREMLFALQHSEVEILLRGDPAVSSQAEQSRLASLGLPSLGSVVSTRVPKLRVVAALAGGSESVQGWMEAGNPSYSDDKGEMLFYSAKYGEYPRGVRIDPSAALGCGHYLGERLGVTEEDRHLNLLPLCNSAGFIDAVLGMHIRGAAVCLVPSFDASQLTKFAIECGCTSTGGSAFLVRRFVDELLQLGWPEEVRLKKLWSAPRLEVLDSALDYRIRQFSCYGLAEASNLATMSLEGDASVSAGSPFPGVEVKIASRLTGEELKPGVPGEICFRGWNIARGYHREPRRMTDAIDECGFFHTGDVGFLDEAGHLEFLTRGSEALRSGGELISPRAIERLLESEWEVVTRVAVVGVADALWGESIVAVVVAATEDPIEIEELRECCRGRLAPFKIPKYLVQLTEDQWPLMSDGSIDRARVRHLANEYVSLCRAGFGHDLVTSA